MCGFLHIDQNFPLPNVEDCLTETVYITGVYIGTSFRPKRVSDCFSSARLAELDLAMYGYGSDNIRTFKRTVSIVKY